MIQTFWSFQTFLNLALRLNQLVQKFRVHPKLSVWCCGLMLREEAESVTFCWLPTQGLTLQNFYLTIDLLKFAKYLLAKRWTIKKSNRLLPRINSTSRKRRDKFKVYNSVAEGVTSRGHFALEPSLVDFNITADFLLPRCFIVLLRTAMSPNYTSEWWEKSCRKVK